MAGDGDLEAACPDDPGSRLQVLSHGFVHARLILSWTSTNQNEKKETALLGHRHVESPLPLRFLDSSGFTAPVLVGVMLGGPPAGTPSPGLRRPLLHTRLLTCPVGSAQASGPLCWSCPQAGVLRPAWRRPKRVLV